jgi:hypothetical protein
MAVVLAPDRHIESSLNPPQSGHSVERGTQSATHSVRFPTMSNTPTSETQAAREPVATTSRAESVL